MSVAKKVEYIYTRIYAKSHTMNLYAMNTCILLLRLFSMKCVHAKNIAAPDNDRSHNVFLSSPPQRSASFSWLFRDITTGSNFTCTLSVTKCKCFKNKLISKKELLYICNKFL